MKNYILILLLTLIFMVQIFAANIEGTVIDLDTGAAVAGVNIHIEGTRFGAATDDEGRFFVENLPAGEYNLKITAQGYEKQIRKSFEVNEDNTILLDIALKPKPIRGEEIVVTSTRRRLPLKDVPDIVLNISSKQIERIEPGNIADIVFYAPGVSVEGGTGSGQPYDQIVSIDGLPAQYSLVLMDGARVVSSHWHTGANINIIPPEAIDRIEILKGASSAQYGSEGLGGAVNIITKRGTEKPEMLFTSKGGDRKTQYYSLLSNGAINEAVKYNYFASWEKTDGDSIIAPAHRLGEFGFDKFTLLNSIDAKICDKIVAKTQMFYLASHNTFRGTKYESWLITPKIDLEFTPDEDINITLSGYYTQWNGEINSEKNEIAEPQVTFGYGGIKDNYLLAGGEWVYRNFRRTSVEEKEQTATGFFLQDEWLPSEKLSLLGAIRFDKVENIDGIISPKLTVKVDPADLLSVRLSIGRGFRAPTVQDLYEESYGHGYYRREGNPDLLPEYSTGINGGIELNLFSSLYIMIDGYFTDMTDMITPIFDHTETIDSTEISVYIRQNVHKATIYGGEVKINYNFFRDFELEGSINITHNENEETGKSLPYYPGMTASAKLSGSEAIAHWIEIGGFVGLNITSGRKVWNWNDISEELELDDYQKLDAGLNLTINNRYEIFGSVENILRQEIMTYEDLTMTVAGISRYCFGLRIRAF